MSEARFWAVDAVTIPEHLVPWVEEATARPLGSGIEAARAADEVLHAAKLEAGAPPGSWIERDAMGEPLAFMWFK